MTGTRANELDHGRYAAGDRREMRRTRMRAGLATGLLLLVGLPGGAVAQDQSAPPAMPTIDVVAPQGQDGRRELGSWPDDQGVTIKVTSFPWDPFLWDQIAESLTTEAFDVATVANQYVRPWIAAGLLAPLDVCRLQNWDDLFPALRESDLIRGEDGQIYGVPSVWGDHPFVYATDRVPKPPRSIKDLLGSGWRERIVLTDEPLTIIHLLAVARGYPSPDLTRKQLKKIQGDISKLMQNSRAILPGQSEAVSLVAQGGADLAVVGGEWMVDAGAQQGAALDFAFFKESQGGWTDVLAIPVNAGDPELAYSYIDALISPEANAQLATNLAFGAANTPAVPLLDPAAVPYDYSRLMPSTGREGASCREPEPEASPEPGASAPPENEGQPIVFRDWDPPEEAEADMATLDDWYAAWQAPRSNL